jgi:hypothetical protein
MLLMKKMTGLALALLGVLAAYGFNGGIPFIGIEKSPWVISVTRASDPLAVTASDFKNPTITPEDITDRKAKFVADPFLIYKNDRWHLFFEVLDAATEKGVIGLATSKNGAAWEYKGVILEEPFHLSFPNVFQANGETYMIPESYQAKQVRLYRAVDFPTEWTLEGVLLEGHGFLDSSVFYAEGIWWLATSMFEDHARSMYLYYADDLSGMWTPHEKNPVIRNDGNRSRLAGKIASINGRLIRFAQDIEPEYGKSVYPFEITEIGADTYSEDRLLSRPLVGPTNHGWNAQKMHHFHPVETPAGDWLVASDGMTADHVAFGLNY